MQPAKGSATYEDLLHLSEDVRAEVPAARTLEALALKSSVWIEVGSWGDDDMARIASFDAVELEVSRLFPPRPPTEPSAM